MNSRSTSFYSALFSLLVTFLLMLNGCGSTPPAQNNQPASGSNPQPVASQQPPAEKGGDYLSRLKFKAEDGSEALVIKRYADHDKIELNFSGTQSIFKGRTDVKERVKYKESSADGSEKTLVAEVKLKDDSFKLVDANEALIWKVKINDGKVKISDNEDGNNSCEIKVKSADKGEIRDQAGNEIGNVRFYADNGKLKVKDAAGKEILVTKDSAFSCAPGVILFNHIPLQHRVIIISEIMRMGK